MAGFFTLTLDTTGPIVSGYAPQYSDRNHNNEIRFISNETLMEYQDIYIIDSQNIRHNQIFSFNGTDEYTGNVTFTDYPMGVATIYGQFKDDVGNLSNIGICQISVVSSYDALVLKITMTEIESIVSLTEKEIAVELDEIESVIALSENKGGTIKFTEKESSVKITEQESIVKLTDGEWYNE